MGFCFEMCPCKDHIQLVNTLSIYLINVCQVLTVGVSSTPVTLKFVSDDKLVRYPSQNLTTKSNIRYIREITVKYPNLTLSLCSSLSRRAQEQLPYNTRNPQVKEFTIYMHIFYTNPPHYLKTEII